MDCEGSPVKSVTSALPRNIQISACEEARNHMPRQVVHVPCLNQLPALVCSVQTHLCKKSEMPSL